jgi:hypothetical protein
MSIDELISQHTVRVGNGSGVLVSALSKEYSYVITAKHNIESTFSIKKLNGDEIQSMMVYRHSESDCAVIKINYLPNILQERWSGESIPESKNLKFSGFSKSHITSDTPLKFYKAELINNQDSHFVCDLKGTPGQLSIDGMSGGGIFHTYKDTPYLVGIEYRMDDEEEDARWGRVRCFPLQKFDEIINQYGLSPILPSFMSCFSSLNGSLLPNDDEFIAPQNISKLKQAIEDLAENLISRGLPSPYDLMNKYEAGLLVGPRDSEAILDRRLWEYYYDFFILCVLIDNPDEEINEYIKTLDRRRRIIYSNDTSNWLRRLNEILLTAKNMLDKNILDKDGTLIVSSPQSNPESLPDSEQIKRVTMDISTIPSRGPLLNIDNTNENSYELLTIRHLTALKKSCVILKETDYGNTDPGTAQLQLLGEFYNEAIS